MAMGVARHRDVRPPAVKRRDSTGMLSTTSLLQAAELMWEQDFGGACVQSVQYDNAYNSNNSGSHYGHHGDVSMSASVPVTRAPSPVHDMRGFATSTTVSPQGSRPLTPHEESPFCFSNQFLPEKMFTKKTSQKMAASHRKRASSGYTTPQKIDWSTPSHGGTPNGHSPPGNMTAKPSFLERRHSNATQHTHVVAQVNSQLQAQQVAGKVKRRRASVADTRNEDRVESKKMFGVYDESRHHRILNLMRKGTVPKCRAVYGIPDKHSWCRQCRYKKACTRSEFFHRDMLSLIERENISFPMTPDSTSPTVKVSPASSPEGFTRRKSAPAPRLVGATPNDQSTAGQLATAPIGLSTLIEAKLVFPGDTLHCKGQTALLSREGLVLSPEGNFTCPTLWAMQASMHKGEPTDGIDGWTAVTLRNGWPLDHVRKQYAAIAAAHNTFPRRGVAQVHRPLTPAGSRSESEEDQSPGHD